jgi:hypothetical protein
MITKTDVIMENPQLSNDPLSAINSESQVKLSKLIQNFNKINISEILTNNSSNN